MCRFCQAGHINLPIRERPKEDVETLVKEYVKNTGYGEYSLLSLSSNDHTQIEDIIFDLNDYFKGSGVSVSLPSQRADKFSLRLANLMQEVRKSAVTIAPEAGTQRLRDIIKKNLTTEQILSATLACIQSGWQKIKYYLMIGLPFETYEDIEGIAELFENVNNEVKKLGIKLPQITCSISIFVPKPFTPFGFAPQNSLEEIYKKITFLKEKAAKYRNVRLNFHTPRLSQVEAFLTRGDERVADFIYELYKEGSYLDSWDENFSYDKYVDTHQVELAEKEPCVLGSRLAIWMLKSADLKVYLYASDETRANRIFNREGGNIDEIKSFTSMRDEEDSRRYKNLYGIDNNDYDFADLIIDTANYNPEEITSLIIDELEKRGL